MITGCEYPVDLKTGMPVDFRDLNLESRLNPAQPRNYNRHHEFWTRRAYKQVGSFVIYETLREIETHVPHMLLDMHIQLHNEYDPPRMPTPLQAITEIERAKDAGEVLTRCRKGLYVCRAIGDDVLKQCIANYDQLKK